MARQSGRAWRRPDRGRRQADPRLTRGADGGVGRCARLRRGLAAWHGLGSAHCQHRPMPPGECLGRLVAPRIREHLGALVEGHAHGGSEAQHVHDDGMVGPRADRFRAPQSPLHPNGKLALVKPLIHHGTVSWTLSRWHCVMGLLAGLSRPRCRRARRMSYLRANVQFRGGTGLSGAAAEVWRWALSIRH